MLRFVFALISVILLSTGCNRPRQDKEAVRQGVVEYAQRLQLSNDVDIQVASVTFKGSEAEALVTFAPKSGPPMSMNYVLENKEGKWIVKGKGTPPPGGAIQPGGAPALPPGHPPTGAASPQALPPGHPPTTSPEASGAAAPKP